MRSDIKDKIRFFLKFITKYFIFGYLCLAGIILLIICGYSVYRFLPFPYNLIAIILFIGALPVTAQFLRITFTTHYKYRYYKISLYRLRTRGYKDQYFECEMHEPCFHLIIKDLLISNGYAKEYYNLKNKCKGKNIRVERAKENLLAKVKRQHVENAT